MREKPNSYLSACLVMVGIRTLTISCNAPILSLRRTSLGRYETRLRPGRKPTHVHIMNRTCPEVVCAIIYLHWGELFLKHLELKTCGVWARIKILVSSYKSDDHMSPLKGQVHYIDCMFIHFFHACTRIKSGSPTSLQHPILSKKTLEIHSVLAASPIFKKVGVSEQKLDSPLAYSSKY